MKKLHFLTISASCGMALLSQATAATVYSNNFEAETIGALGVGDTLGGGGAIVGTGSSVTNVGIVTTAYCGPLEMGNVFEVADDSWFDSGIDFDTMLGSAGSSTETDYTMAAWLNFPSVGTAGNATQDRFVIGTQGGTNSQELHLGTRQGNYHSGHWSDDVGGAGATANIGNWHYVVWTNDGGTQEIFVDGVSVASGATGTPNRNFGDLIIGGARGETTRDFVGQVGGFAVFDTVLSVDQQKSVALSVAIPEPSRAILLGLGLGLSLLCVRRRR